MIDVMAISQNNRETVKGKRCSCYFCLSYFDGDSVTDYTDDGKTAICPKCDVYSVLPESVEMAELIKLNERFFCGIALQRFE